VITAVLAEPQHVEFIHELQFKTDLKMKAEPCTEMFGVRSPVKPRGDPMLASGKMVGFVPTKDYEKARTFYEAKLGFDFVSLDQFALVMRAGGHMIRIVKMPNFTPLQGTILGWEVEDVASVAGWLQDRGVTLEKYPFVQDRELGIWTTPNGDKVAWFKDPDGNALSISQHH
jgi:catechol 2,3-dioxygenase-like lactoylglutathione lyase family enzyme